MQKTNRCGHDDSAFQVRSATGDSPLRSRAPLGWGYKDWEPSQAQSVRFIQQFSGFTPEGSTDSDYFQ
jgi:hypothetical protein